MLLYHNSSTFGFVEGIRYFSVCPNGVFEQQIGRTGGKKMGKQ